MKLLETYASSCGLMINKPDIFTKFFPLPFEKYITIGTSSGMGSKNYDYFREVLSLIRDPLYEAGYKILQIGNKDDARLDGIYDICGLTDIGQLAYVISKSSLNISNDTFSAHLAGHYNVPLVTLFGITRPQNCAPYWGDVSKQIFLESHRNGKKPSYNPQENPKTINLIKPEEVAHAALLLLELQAKQNIETIYIGEKYIQTVIEVVPNQILAPNYLPELPINIRMDYHFDENVLFNQLAVRKCCVITDKPINTDTLKQLKANVLTVIYELKEDYKIEFVAKLREAAIPYNLVTRVQDEQIFNKMKLDFLDYNMVMQETLFSRSDIKDYEKIDSSSYYKSNKFLLSDGKIYLNRFAWECNEHIEDFLKNEGAITQGQIENPSFWQESPFYFIYNKNV